MLHQPLPPGSAYAQPQPQPPNVESTWQQNPTWSPAGFPTAPGMPPGVPQGYGPPCPPQQALFPPSPGIGKPAQGFQSSPASNNQQQYFSSLPSVVEVYEEDRQVRSGFFQTGFPTADYPPLSTTPFEVRDTGNANPKFLRSSLYSIPVNQDFLKTSALPFVLEVSPFAQQSSSDPGLPVVDLGELGPIRCNRCKAYMCPGMEFIDGGRKFRCVFCHGKNPIPDTYFAHLDHTGRRTDIQFRPEQYLGSYEFVATKEYCQDAKFPQQPGFLFFLDVSYAAMQSGVVAAFAAAVPQILKNLPRHPGAEKSSMRVGFIAYDHMMYFYDLNSDSVHMHVVSSVDDVYTPFLEGLMVPADKAEAALQRVLVSIATDFADTKVNDIVLGPLIHAGLSVFKDFGCGGKIFIFSTGIPNFEAPGKLTAREDRKLLGTDKEKPQLEPANEFYLKLGDECIKAGVGISLYLFTTSSVDLATIAPGVTISGGSIYHYPFYDNFRDGERFTRDLIRDTSRCIAFDVMMRIRTSTGIRPTNFFGSFSMPNATDIELGVLHADYTFTTEVKYDDKLDAKQPVFVQVATLFTSCSGQRRVRIHNLSLAVTDDYNVLYNNAYMDTMVAYFIRGADRLVREKNYQEAKEDLAQRCVHILATYRTKCRPQAPPSQLLFPETLKLLAVYANCVSRSDAFHGGNEMTVDERIHLMATVPSMRTDFALRFLYPQIVAITWPQYFESGASPPVIRAAMGFFSPDEIYFIENGFLGIVWIGERVNHDAIRHLLGVDSIQQVGEHTRLVELDNPHSRAFHAWLRNTTAQRPFNPKIHVIRQHDRTESWVRKFLVEDKYANDTLSYPDFICLMHSKIRKLLS